MIIVFTDDGFVSKRISLLKCANYRDEQNYIIFLEEFFFLKKKIAGVDLITKPKKKNSNIVSSVSFNSF
jgi:hypothetical protein